MSGRVVIHIDEHQDGGVTCSVHRAPFAIQNVHSANTIDLSHLVAIGGANAVQAVGEGLIHKIRSNNKVDEVFTLALANPPSESLPILFRVSDHEAHGLSWESLYENDHFLALEGSWPVGRVPSGGDIPDDTTVPLDPPIRLVLVISALDRSGLAELQTILDRVESAVAADLDIEVAVIGSEVDVKDEVVRRVGQAGFRAVPDSPTELLNLIDELDPDLLHFFCHGAIETKTRLLDIATAADWKAGSGNSSVRLNVEELAERLDGSGIWAVVLNTCASAAVGGDPDRLGLTHAQQLVVKGVPVAIGMRRMIDAADATRFSGEFYRSAFDRIDAALESADRRLEWADTLLSARRALRDAHGDPADADSWTLPVLYTRSGLFTLTDPGTGVDVSRRQIVEGLLAVLPAEQPVGLTDDLQNLL